LRAGMHLAELAWMKPIDLPQLSGAPLRDASSPPAATTATEQIASRDTPVTPTTGAEEREKGSSDDDDDARWDLLPFTD